MQLLYINSDFDEHELETKVYTSIEDFVKDRIGIAYNITDLEVLAEDRDNMDEIFVLELIKTGSHEGQWSTEEVWLLENGKFKQGI